MTLLSAMCLQPDTHTCMSIYHKCMYTHTLYIRLSCCAPCSLFCGIVMLSSRWATLCAGPPSPSPPPDDSSPPPFNPPPDAPGNSGCSLHAVPFANTHALGSLLSRELLLWLLPCRETASLYASFYVSLLRNLTRKTVIIIRFISILIVCVCVYVYVYVYVCEFVLLSSSSARRCVHTHTQTFRTRMKSLYLPWKKL
jgi:hypothetical protein